MRFLADECCDFAAVRALRAHGHDVLAVGEFQSRSVDRDVMGLALAEDRILLTEDKDFGWLVFAARMDSPGVILIRFPASARTLLADGVLKLVSDHGSQLAGAFVVLRPGEARVGFVPRRLQ
jgi:predicted nuclease of predicted toxin-antitoxin system